MCEIKTNVVSVTLLVETSFSIESILRTKWNSRVKAMLKKPCEIEYKGYCFNGERCYLLDEDIVICN